MNALSKTRRFFVILAIAFAVVSPIVACNGDGDNPGYAEWAEKAKDDAKWVRDCPTLRECN